MNNNKSKIVRIEKSFKNAVAKRRVQNVMKFVHDLSDFDNYIKTTHLFEEEKSCRYYTTQL